MATPPAAEGNDDTPSQSSGCHANDDQHLTDLAFQCIIHPYVCLLASLKLATSNNRTTRVARSFSQLVASQLLPGDLAKMAKSQGILTNLGVDYVVVFNYANTDKAKAEDQFKSLVRGLATVGLATEVRPGEADTLLVFVKAASEAHLFAEIYRSRVKDWMHGVRNAAPPTDVKASLVAEPLTEAERLRIIYQMITNETREGGAGLTPKKGQWESVDAIFTLHDHVYNKEWLKKWSTQWFLTLKDLDDIRDRLGEQVAFYFAFTQTYFQFLIVPAAFGAAAYSLLGSNNAFVALAISLWCIVFVEFWKHQQIDYAIRWGVRGVSKIERKRPEFESTKEVKDEVTGEVQQIFPATKRLQRQLLIAPFAILAALLLGSLIAMAFGIEIFITEVYDGPLKSILTFLPTIILTTGLPLLTNVLTMVATRMSDFENYETDTQHLRSMTEKIFVLNFITSYLPIFLTAFVYIPFGSLIVPYLDVFSLTVRPFAENEKQLKTPTSAQFSINPARLRNQVFYFTVTAQIVNLATEVIVPYAKRQGFLKYKQIQNKRAQKNGGARPDVGIDDHPEEKEFLARVRSEVDLEVYDVATDFREMVVQFGYLALFGVVWPLAPVSFLINNWIELRADAAKICVGMQRPTPWRADSIGPWLDSLSFLSWLGSITMAAVVFLFSNDGVGIDGRPSKIQGWALLLTIFFSEHLYLFARWAIALVISRIDSPGRQQERRDRFATREKYFEESMQHVHTLPAITERAEEVTRSSLEEDARQGSLKTATSEGRFWSRQRHWTESAKVGQDVIARALPANKSSTHEKKEL